MKIIVAKGKNFEKHNLIEKFIRVFSVPILNIIPAFVLQKIMIFSSRDAATAVKHGGTTYALEAMYTRYERKVFSRGFLEGLADLFWHHCVSQPKAIRNRLKIVEASLKDEFFKLSKKKKDITILTVAGGSARGVIKFISNFLEKNPSYKIKIINIDKSQRALELSREIAKKFNVYNFFKWINADARDIKKLVLDNSVDIVEMVGLLDYFSDEKGEEVIRQIYNSLKINGVFIVGNVYPNVEMPFVRRVGWPEMYYRMPSDLSNVLKKSGFSLKRGKIIIEPLKSHIIAIIKK